MVYSVIKIPHDLVPTSSLVMVSIAMRNIMIKSKLGEKGNYFILQHVVHHSKKSVQDFEAGNDL